MKSTKVIFSLIVLFVFALSVNVFPHCEIPCGIYDDAMRIKMLNEDIATIEKSMQQINALEKQDHSHANQLVRWVINKDEHASKIQEIVTQYFMTQRIKLDTENYDKKISLLHQMLIVSMKCKQTTDLENTKKLTELVKQFEKLYFTK